jgi:hypothetical protein
LMVTLSTLTSTFFRCSSAIAIVVLSRKGLMGVHCSSVYWSTVVTYTPAIFNTRMTPR